MQVVSSPLRRGYISNISTSPCYLDGSPPARGRHNSIRNKAKYAVALTTGNEISGTQSLLCIMFFLLNLNPYVRLGNQTTVQNIR